MSELFSTRCLLAAPLMLLLQLFGSPSLGAPGVSPGSETTATQSSEALNAEIARLRHENDDASKVGDYDRAAIASGGILDLEKRRSVENPADYARAVIDHSKNLRALNRAAEAEPLDRQALARTAATLGEKNPYTFLSLQSLADGARRAVRAGAPQGRKRGG